MAGGAHAHKEDFRRVNECGGVWAELGEEETETINNEERNGQLFKVWHEGECFRPNISATRPNIKAPKADAKSAVESTRLSSNLPTCQIGFNKDITTPMMKRS